MNYESLNVLRRPLAVLLGLTATYALVHFAFNSLYDETSLMLDILGYIMAVGATFFVVLNIHPPAPFGRAESRRSLRLLRGGSSRNPFLR